MRHQSGWQRHGGSSSATAATVTAVVHNNNETAPLHPAQYPLLVSGRAVAVVVGLE